jgi:hypothetical protein
MSEEFCDGVKILLKRMESNPEEFKDMDRWEEFTNHHQLRDGFWSHALTPAEIEALQDGMRKIYRDVFTNRVMSKLLEDKEEPLRYKASERYGAGWTDPRGSGLGGGGGVIIGGGHNGQSLYPQISAFAESHPPKEKLSLGELLKQKLAKI